MTTFDYNVGDEAPPIRLPWLDEDGVAIDFTTGWTFAVSLVAVRNGTPVTFTTPPGVIGGVGYVDVVWVEGNLDLPKRTTYRLLVIATETGSGKERTWRPADPVIVRVGWRA